MTDELKPTGWLYRLRGKSDTTLVSKNKVNNFEQFNPKWQKSAPVYAIPPTHRVVSLELLREAMTASYLSNPDLHDRLSAIIDNPAESKGE